MSTWKKTLFTMLMLGLQLPALATTIPMTLYKNPNCGCCDAYADYLNAHGFDVKLINTTDMSSIKRNNGVPENLAGCHTAIVNGYVFEGMIPAENIKRVLDAHSPIKGLSVPGMPAGATGMPGNKKGPINVYYLEASSTPRIFSSF